MPTHTLDPKNEVYIHNVDYVKLYFMKDKKESEETMTIDANEFQQLSKTKLLNKPERRKFFDKLSKDMHLLLIFEDIDPDVSEVTMYKISGQVRVIARKNCATIKLRNVGESMSVGPD